MAASQGTKLKDHRVLALDIGTRFIKIAEMRLARGVVSLINVAVCPTPAELVDKSQILDPVALGKEIRAVLAANKIATRNVVAAVRGQSSVVVRPIELPKVASKKELVDTMKFEVERHIPFAANEVVMDYAPFVEIGELPEEEENMRVLLAVAQEELINTYLKVLKAAKLTPVALDVEILAAIRSLVDIRKDLGAYEDTVALVNIGATSTDISIVSQGNLTFNRSVPIAGDALTNAIVEQLGRTFEEAEELKIEHGRIFVVTAAGELPVPADEEPGAVSADDGIFSAFGATENTQAWQPSGAPVPQQMFSLEDEPANTSAFNFSLSPEASTAPATPVLPPVSPAEAQPFTVAAADADHDAAAGRFVFSLDDEHEADTPAAFSLNASPTPTSAMFDLGAEPEEDAPVSFSFESAPPAASPVFDMSPETDAEPVSFSFNASPPAASPVFDLSSEIEEQMPVRPSFSLSNEPEPTPPPAAEAFDALHFGDEDASTLSSVDAASALPATPVPSSEMVPVATDMMAQLDAPVSAAPSTPAQDEVFQRRVFESMQPILVELATEIRRSLEYYSNREPDNPVKALYLFGGTSRLPKMAEFLHEEIGLEVHQADPLDMLDVTACKLPAEYLQDLASVLPVCIGLGLRDMLA
ncbi:MAG TPA: type IV pilus assembly protein PilM [Armatimonadota bacterium]|jgi:type IV pilus assembly protein PilM